VRASTSGTGYNEEASARSVVTVGQYFLVSLTSENSFFETDKPNVGTTFALRVWNKGNGPDSFELEVSNLRELVGRRWSVRLDKAETPVIQPGLYADVAVTVTPPGDQSAFDSTMIAVIMKATSVQGRDQNIVISMSFPFYLQIKAVDIVFDVTVPIIVLAVVAASVAVVALRWRKRRKGRALDVEEAPPT